MSKVIIEKAKPENLQSIIEIQKETWLATYPNKKFGITKEDILKRLGKPGDDITIKRIETWQKIIKEEDKQKVIFVAKLENKIIGFAIVNNQPKPTIGALYVLPFFQGQGAGNLLVNKSLLWLGKQPAIYTYVAIYNQKAINFYNNHGFIKTNTKPSDKYALEHGLKEIPTLEMVLKD